jgi:hypothetical protein
MLGNRRLLDELRLAYAGNRWETGRKEAAVGSYVCCKDRNGISAVIDLVLKLDG